MSGENPGDNPTGDPREFLSKPKWQRFLVAIAGPTMNVILAVSLLTGLYMYGSEVAEFWNDAATVGMVEAGSPASIAGIQPGDRILLLDGKKNPNWQEVEPRILTSPEHDLPIVLDRHGKRIETSIRPIRKGQAELGYAGMEPQVRVVVRHVRPGSPAAAAGLLSGDEIVSVNGIDLKTHGLSIQETIQGVAESTFPIEVLRNGQKIELRVTPILEGKKRMIGIDIPVPMVMIKLGPVDAFKRAIDANVENGTLIFQVLGKLVTRETSMKSFDGPIGIAKVSGQAFNAGFASLIQLMALISLNLGVMNALPIPILDGGVMLMLLVEGAMGRDLSLRLKERIIQVSFVCLLMFTAFVLYNDVMKLFPVQPTP
jgi:regulator of sigma E protease